MKRRYEVFVSSTCHDLSGPRAAVIEATVKSGHLPSGMEFFPAGRRDQDLIEESILGADIVAIFLGARYGSEVRGMENHFIEYEYNLAVKHQKPILPFLLNDDEYAALRGRIPDGDHERTHDDALRAFRSRLKENADGTGRVVNFFSLKGDIAELVATYQRALTAKVQELESEGDGGWIRYQEFSHLKAEFRELKENVHLGRGVSNNPFFSRFVKRLNAYDKLSLRCTENVPNLKKSIANYFMEQYLGRLAQSRIRKLFFESGSSIAFVSEAFIGRLQEDWMKQVAPDLRIQTNNILTYLDFLLSERVQVDLFPYGPPEAKYGATFGPLTTIPPLPLPFIPSPLSTDAKKTVAEVRDSFRKRYTVGGLILMTISGIDLAPGGKSQGPHVGSFYNRLFKRAMLTARVPIVMFLDETKVPLPFDPEKCFPVCDEEVPWPNICTQAPFAMAVACETRNKVDKLIQILGGFGLDLVETISDSSGQSYPLIASNSGFRELW